jgi:hypothetical protein
LPSIPRESAGKAGWDKEFGVEELFLACPPLSSSPHGLEFLAIGENFLVNYPRESDHLQQRTEVPSPRLCRAMGHQEWLEPSRYTRTEE